MPVSGLVLTLSEHSAERALALAALQQSPAIEVGELADRRLPIVVDTPDSEADREIWRWLHELKGVLFVDLVSTDSSADVAAQAGRDMVGRGCT